MKEIRFGKKPEEYTDKDGNKKTSWPEVGYKLFIDGEKITMLDVRNGSWVVFPKKNDEENKAVNEVEEEINF